MRGGAGRGPGARAGVRCIVAALLLAGCEPVARPTPEPGAPPSAPPVVARSPDDRAPALHETLRLPVSAPHAPDRVSVEALGRPCAEASLLLTVRSGDGRLLWTHTARAGDALPPDAAADRSSCDALRQTLLRWLASAEVRPAASAPPWPESAPRPGAEGGLFHETAFPRDDYLRLRASGRRMLCHEAAWGETVCALHVADAEPAFLLRFYSTAE